MRWSSAKSVLQMLLIGLPVVIGCHQKNASAPRDRNAPQWRFVTDRHPLSHREKVIQLDIGQVASVAFSADSQLIAAGAVNGETLVWNFNGKSHLLLRCDDDFRGRAVALSVAWSPKDRYLCFTTDDDGVRVWDVKGPKRVAQLPFGHMARTCRFSHDGRWLAIGGVSNLSPGFGFDSTVSLWKWDDALGTEFVRDGRLVKREINPEQGPIRDAFWISSIDFSTDDSQFLASGRFDCQADSAKRGKVRTGAKLSMTSRERQNAFVRGELSMEGKLFKKSEHDAEHGIICIWDVESGELLEEVRLLNDDSVDALFGSDDNWIFYVGEEKTLRVIDSKSRSDLPANLDVDWQVESFNVSHDKSLLAVNFGQHINIYHTGSLARVNTNHVSVDRFDEINAVAVSPDNKLAAAGTKGGAVYVWEIVAEAEDR